MKSEEKIVFYEEIGRVRYVKHKRARNITIRINQNGEVRVTVPRSVSRRKAEAFLISRKKWILQKRSELESLGTPAHLLREGYPLIMGGRTVPLRLERNDRTPEDALWRILLEEARLTLPPRVNELAMTHGFQYSGLKIRRMKTRWGSCTARNSLNLNSWLLMPPSPLADYVIPHKLAHTRHKDHSRSFWEELDRVTGGQSKVLRRELRNQRIMYFPSAQDQ